MSEKQHPEFDGHEKVVWINEPSCGLRALISIHSTALGPAMGGCRMWPYPNEDEALADALRLSRGMSYKNAIAGLPLGGGKAVIFGEAVRDKTPALLDAFGRHIEALEGRYITAEDAGMSVEDLQRIANQTRYVTGLQDSFVHSGGDPSPKTAYGVFDCIRAILKQVHGRDSLQGARVAIQGVGAVGLALAELLHANGVSLVVSDRAPERALKAKTLYGAEVVPNDRILAASADVLAPCALGAILNESSIADIQAPVICGAANNQLAEAADGQRLLDRGILYAPDYVANAGGIITAASEYLKCWSAAETLSRIVNIAQTVMHVIEQARVEGRPTNLVADDWARTILRAGAQASAAHSPFTMGRNARITVPPS